MKNKIMPLLQTSAMGAAGQCIGGPSGTACGRQWWRKDYDGNAGVGEQMSALSAIQYTLIKKAETAQVPVTATTGGTSVGNVNAGTSTGSGLPVARPVTMGERVAAGFATTAVLFSVLGGSVFLIKD
jgi:mannan endo-1,6-alpha-mannosidase